MQEARRGDRVSLNTSKRLFYFQEDGGLNLIAGENETAIIPDSATEKHLAQINHAIKHEQLVIGSPVIKADLPDRDSDIMAVLELGRDKVDDWTRNIQGDKTVRNELKTEILEKLISFEKSGKNRKSVIRNAEYVLGCIGGVSPVMESEQEKLEIKLTSGNGEAPETT